MGTHISSKVSVVVAIIAVVMTVLGAPAAARPGEIIEYPVSTSEFGGPNAIAAGPDGNMWFTAIATNDIGRITPDGTVTRYSVPSEAAGDGDDIAAGPDGNMWFTELNGNAIGRITPTGTVTEYPMPTAYSWPFEIAAGPDGNMWFTRFVSSQNVGNIGRINPATGAISEYPLPTAGVNPGGIAAGPDGNMWFTEGGKIGRITPAGAITEYPLPKASSGSFAIAAGPDGNMWFTELYGNAIGRINPATGRITEFALPTPDASPVGIAAGPDGNMWFTESGADRIGRITPRGRITEYPLPEADSTPSGITAGPDGNMWFTEMNGERIVLISPTAPPPAVRYPCPVNVTLHKPTPKTTGSRILTDKITTKSTSCQLLKPVVLCRPLTSTAAGEKAFCDTKVTKRGMIRVNTAGDEAIRVTVIARAKPKPGQTGRWKPGTWRKTWILREPAETTNKGETDLALSQGLVQTMADAGVDIDAIRGATLSKSGVVTFPVTSVKGDVITHKGALRFSSSSGFVTLQNIALNYTTGKATALVQAPAVNTGIQISDLLNFTGGTNQIKQKGTWTQATVALATSTSVGNPAPLFASQLGLPSGSIPTGLTIGKATITLQFS